MHSIFIFILNNIIDAHLHFNLKNYIYRKSERASSPCAYKSQNYLDTSQM